MKTIKKQTFGDHLRELREAAGLSPEQLGERCGVRGSVVRKLEDGQNRFPRLDTAKKLAVALGVDVNRLAEWE